MDWTDLKKSLEEKVDQESYIRAIKRLNYCINSKSLQSDKQLIHVVNEFGPGIFLNEHGFRFQYEADFFGKLPDWLDIENKIVLEVLNIDDNPNKIKFSTQHFRRKLRKKCPKYKNLVKEHEFGYIIAICPGEAMRVSTKKIATEAFLKNHRYLSGVLIKHKDNFVFIKNKFATVKINITL